MRRPPRSVLVAGRAMLALCVIVVTFGCAFGELSGDYPDPAALTDDAVVGSWRNIGHPGMFVFKADGTFSATNVAAFYRSFPDILPSGFHPGHDQLDNTGDWHIAPPIGGSVPSEVKLDFDTIPNPATPGPVAPGGFATSLHGFLQDGTIMLTGAGYEYDKCPGACPTPPPTIGAT